MSNTPLTDSINALTQYANSVSGQSDQTLSDAVYTLAQGYGSGGATLIERGSYTPTEDVYSNAVQISHGLGVQPDFVVVTANSFEPSTEYTAWYIVQAICLKTTNITSNQTTNGALAYVSRSRATWYQIQSNQSDVLPSKFMDTDYFKIPYQSSSDTLKAGVTYNYVIGKFTA